MGWDYAFVHVKYTIPPAVLLTVVFFPLCTRLDVYKVCFLISIAVLATTPWDSHLIRTSIWTYSPESVLGPTLFSIPIEEVFFFIVQTYITSLIYLIFNRPVVHSAHLRIERSSKGVPDCKTESWTIYRTAVQGAFALLLWFAASALIKGGSGTYLGLILVWSIPFLVFLFSFSYQLLFSLPLTATLLPILLPTVYLWFVDTVSLRSGTWTITAETKTGYFLWPNLEIEEAIFFLLTNCLVVFGQLAFDNALAVVENMEPLVSQTSRGALPSPAKLVRALLISPSRYDSPRIRGTKDGVLRLERKSRSFYLASSAFQGRLRVDLILLYSFCRVADDMVDEAANVDDGREIVSKLQAFVNLAYDPKSTRKDVQNFVQKEFPPAVQSALVLLPVHLLTKQPLVDLVRGLEMDLQFGIRRIKNGRANGSRPLEQNGEWPIQSIEDLESYGSLVAGTVGSSVLDLAFAHSSSPIDTLSQDALRSAASSMGTALQLINVVRDVRVDAQISRVYLPASYLKDESLRPEDVLNDPGSDAVRKVKMRVLKRAFEIYETSRPALVNVPPGANKGMRVAVESYVDIGRVMWERGCYDESGERRGKASVPLGRRVWVAWSEMVRG